jgi:hypothetical protein
MDEKPKNYKRVNNLLIQRQYGYSIRNYVNTLTLKCINQPGRAASKTPFYLTDSENVDTVLRFYKNWKSGSKFRLIIFRVKWGDGLGSVFIFFSHFL